MGKIWILLVVVNGCASSVSGTWAYQSEKECQMALDKEKQKEGVFTSVKGNCASIDYVIEETKRKGK